MKILYGIQGTGNGHISRARVLANKLARYPNLEITYLFSGRAKKDFFDMEAFGDFLHVAGLTFISKNGKIDHFSTAKQNNLLRFYQDIKSLNVEQYDLVITDFEPVTAWAAKTKNKPVLGIGHQYAFGENTPLAGDNYFTRLIMRKFAPAKHSFGLHWHPYSDNILPPIIDTDIVSSNENKHVLVYLPFEDQTQVTAMLTQIPNVNFVQYSPDLSNQTKANVETRTTNYLGFKKDLVAASAVICNSGFELISECLHLGLPILTKPLNGQMEQHSNALALQQLQHATVVKALTLENIARWCQEQIKPNAKPLPDVAGAIAHAIVNNQWRDAKPLSAQLWQ
ncbi:MAG: MJ1255/VC2487 family glycosyltransferase [Thalassotalea sp.]